jgi:hypothetical protein
VLLRTDKPWLYQAVLACCTNPVYNRYHTSQTAATEHCELHNMLWDICIPVPVCQFGRTYISLYLAVTWCTNPACSSDHNYQTTSRQLQATELFKLSRLVVVCLRFLCAGRQAAIAGVPGCVCVLHEPCACGSNQNSWQTAATAVRAAQHASNHVCLAWCIRVVQQNLHAPPNCVDMLHKPCTCNRCTSLCMPKA